MNIYSRTMALFAMMSLASAQTFGQFTDDEYYLLNVGANMYLGGGNLYGTQASLIKSGLPFTFEKVDESTYTINSSVFNSESDHYLGKNLYIDSSKANWTIEQTSNETYTIAIDGNYLTYDGQSTVIKTSKDSSTKNSQWKIISKKERMASLKANSDATFLIKDATFSRNAGSAYGVPHWKIASVSDFSKLTISSGNGQNNCAEADHITFEVLQLLEGIPNGTYSLTCQGVYNADGKGNYFPELFMNDESEEFIAANNGEKTAGAASNSFALGFYQIPSIKATVYDGTLTIGVKLERNMNIWCSWDNFELTYVSDLNLSEYKRSYTKTVNKAKELLLHMMSADAKTILENAIAQKYEFNESIDIYKEAVSDINDAIVNASNSINIYNNIYDSYAKHRDLDEFGQDYFTNASSEIMEAYANGSITDGTEELAKLEEIFIEALKMQITPGTDMTAVIVNPEINGDFGWTIEKPNGGNGPLLNNNSFEYWAGDNIDEDDRSFNYYQTITGLQNGVYTVSCEAFNSMNGINYGFLPSSGIYAESGGKRVKTMVDIDSDMLRLYTTPKIKVVNGTLTIGVTNFNTMVARWFVADNFTLTLDSPDPALDIESVNTATESSYEYFSLDGKKLSSPRQGINIKKDNNGKTTKVYVK